MLLKQYESVFGLIRLMQAARGELQRASLFRMFRKTVLQGLPIFRSFRKTLSLRVGEPAREALDKQAVPAEEVFAGAVPAGELPVGVEPEEETLVP